MKCSLTLLLVTFVLLCLLGLQGGVLADAYRPVKALPSTEDSAEVKYIRSLGVAALRKYIGARDAKCSGCVERRHLVERALEVRGWMTESERLTAQLTPIQSSAQNALSYQHISAEMPVVPTADGSDSEQPQGQLVTLTNYRPQLAAVQRQFGIVCQDPLVNGTQYCMKVEGGLSTM